MVQDSWGLRSLVPSPSSLGTHCEYSVQALTPPMGNSFYGKFKERAGSKVTVVTGSACLCLPKAASPW